MIKHVRSHFYQVLHTPCRWCGAKTPRMDNHKMVCTKNPHNKIKRKYTFQDPRNRAPRQPIENGPGGTTGGQLAITGSINGMQEYDMFVGDMNDGDEGFGNIRSTLPSVLSHGFLAIEKFKTISPEILKS